MEQSSTDTDNRNLLSLPVELLVYIVSFLTEVRDKVKLRYVSRRVKSISETPSLWRKFVWRYYDRLEERCLCNLLKACGPHIAELSFPNHVTPSKLVKLLQRCGDVRHLSLSKETKLSIEQITNILQHMEHLSVLKIRLSVTISSLLQLTKNVEHLTIYIRSHNPDDWYLHVLHEWVVNDNAPKNLSIVTIVRYEYHVRYYDSLLLNLLQSWSEWNTEMPVSRKACLRLYTYDSIALPLNLSDPLPVFQLQYGETTCLPLVNASKFGLLGLRDDLLLLTDCPNGSKMVNKAKIVSFSVRNSLNDSITDLSFVTHFDVGYTERQLYSGHLEQIAIACPNLVWLNLFANAECLQNLQGLELISKCCEKLQALNLLCVPFQKIECQITFWDILSSMKLKELAIQLCTLKPQDEDDTDKLIHRFQNCLSLQSLETCGYCCMYCGEIEDDRPFLFAHFPSLSYCRLNSDQPQSAKEIITTCQGLKIFYCSSYNYLILSSACYCILEQLCIQSENTDLNDTIMDTVSAHGGLVHVVFAVGSVPSEGITALINNSHKLITFNIITADQVYDKEGMKVNLKALKAALKAKYSRRKLFMCGNLRLIQENITCVQNVEEFLENTDLVQLNGDTI